MGRGRIDLEFRFAHPPAKVWRALTEREALAAWFMENDFEPRVDHEFTFRTDPAPGFDGVIRCRVLEIEPERRLRFSWRGGPVDTVVTWTLEPDGDETRLRVEQTGFAGIRAHLVRLMLRGGSKSLFGKRLRDHLGRRSPTRTDDCMNPATRFWAWLATRFRRTPR